MSNLDIDVAVVNIMGREFKLKCPKDKLAELQEAATYLNNKMSEAQRGDKLVPIDRIAITAALNIAHELILEKQNVRNNIGDCNVLNKQARQLGQKLDQALAKFS